MKFNTFILLGRKKQMSHYFLLILLSTWSQSETIAASKCFKYIEIEEENESSILENMVFISWIMELQGSWIWVLDCM